MTVIELGDPGSPPATPAPRRRWDPRGAVRWIAVAQVLLCAAVVTGSAVPGSPVARPAWSVPFGRASLVTVAEDTVFVFSPVPGPRITAYDLDSGAVRWSQQVAPVRDRMIAQQPGALIVPVTGDGGAADTEALDLRSGAPLWRLPGDVIATTPESALLAGMDATVQRVRMADGEQIWSRPAGGAESWAVAGHEPPPGRLVGAAADGRVQVLRLTDGVPLLQGRLPQGHGAPVAGGVIVEAGVIYVNRMETDRAVVTAYDLDTLAPRWQFAQAASDALPEEPAARPCGVVICFRDGTSTAGLDPGTGTVRWRAGGWIDVTPTADASRLLADSPDHAWHALIDSGTGRVAAALGAGTVVWDYRHSAPAYYVRATDTAGPGLVASRIGLRTGRLEPRGPLDAIGFPGCTAAGDHLVCGTRDGRLAVTSFG